MTAPPSSGSEAAPFAQNPCVTLLCVTQALEGSRGRGEPLLPGDPVSSGAPSGADGSRGYVVSLAELPGKTVGEVISAPKKHRSLPGTQSLSARLRFLDH